MCAGVGDQSPRLSTIVYRGSVRVVLLVICIHDNCWVSLNQVIFRLKSRLESILKVNIDLEIE